MWGDNQMYKSFKKVYTLYKDGEKVAYNLESLGNRFSRLGNAKCDKISTCTQQYKDVIATTRSTVESSLKTIKAHADDFATEEQLMTELSNQSKTADGQMKALKAGNDISVALIGQFQKMRQIQLTQAQAAIMKEGMRDEKEELNLEAELKVLKGVCSKVPTLAEIKKKGDEACR
jgi:P-type conjugative transfer protein TrbJ